MSWPAGWTQNVEGGLNLVEEDEKTKVRELLAAKPSAVSTTATAAAAASGGETRWPASKIRETFVEFFKANGHTHWPSSPVVPHEDPTLLFANAGMNQFKAIFLGTIEPKAAMAKLKRACNSQKCIRAGGKHNDLDDVGKDTYHHTFFEMLGNWSFGDYFKEEAIRLAWECLTVAFGLNPERLYATYFGGDEVKARGVPSDEETRQLWLRYLPAERVLPFDAGDNFWEMGDSGPCGPCTEIHYDRIGGRDAAGLVNADDPNVIEIWNNVFIQYNRDSSGLKTLPSQHVDTGMGFERLASILQGKMSNYDTDVFAPLFAAVRAACRDVPPEYSGKLEDDVDTAYRVVADHVRTLSFAIADGAQPDNLGRGYVLRRVLRRAVWYGQHFLKAPKGFLHTLVPALVANMGEAYPELRRAEATIRAVLEGEERDFNRTIDKGARFFAKKAEALGPGEPFGGRDAFHLAGTLGFPLDLTQIMAEERGLVVDVAAYQAALDEDKRKNELALQRRKAARSGAADLTFGAEQTAALAAAGVPKTTTEAKYVWHGTPPATVVAVFAGRGKGDKGDGFVAAAPPDAYCGLVLDATSFYAEMGGQVADTGALLADEASVFAVEDAQVYAGYVVHLGVAAAELAVGDRLHCAVDYDRRARIAPNHTMTHVLNFALREVLLDGSLDAGEHKCAQRGSHVDPERLRFDFAWDAPLTPPQLERVEQIVRDQIAASLSVECVETPLADAMAVETLRCMKGEQYPDPVRVCSVGAPVADLVAAPTEPRWRHHSVELCGGTHLRNTADAVEFALLVEEGIAKGVRRVVAVTRDKAAAARAVATTARETLAGLAKADVSTPAALDALEKDIKTFRNALDRELVMPAFDKIAVRADLERIVNTKIKAAQKLVAAAKADAAAGDFEALAKSAASGVGCARIDFGDDTKLFAKLQKSKLAKLAPDASFCVLSKVDDATLALFTVVSKPHAAAVNAVHWAQHVADAAPPGATAKGGGKPTNAKFTVSSGSAPFDDAAIDALLKAAQAFVKL